MFRYLTIVFVLLLCCFAGEFVTAQIQPEASGVDEHVGALLPLDARFVKEDGNAYPLEKFFESGRPVILTMNYSNCPMLCNLQLTNLVAALRDMEIQPGKDFDIVSVSIDPREGPRRARETKEKYVQIYGKEGTADSWHFLTGKQEEIERLATVVGFRYQYIPKTKEYIHPPVFIMCSPDGRIMRYVHGVDFQPEELQQALVASGKGESGDSISKFIFSCFLDRSYSGQYSVSVMKIMRAAGIMTVVIVLCTLLPFWLKGAKRYVPDENSGDRGAAKGNLPAT